MAVGSSVLEKFHCKMFLNILSKKESNIFENLGKDPFALTKRAIKHAGECQTPKSIQKRVFLNLQFMG
jgi:hypothetical protein